MIINTRYLGECTTPDCDIYGEIIPPGYDVIKSGQSILPWIPDFAEAWKGWSWNAPRPAAKKPDNMTYVLIGLGALLFIVLISGDGSSKGSGVVVVR